MAQSSLEVSNAALYKLGEKSISSLGDSIRQAEVCNARVDICKRALLRRHPWNFAVKRYKLEPTWSAITGAASDGSSDDQIRITAASHGLSNGNRVTIHEVEGTTEANGTWVIADKTANTFDLVDSDFTNTYTSAGEWTLAGVFDYDYSIALPSDCLRLLVPNLCDWRVEAGRLLTNDDENEIKYIYDVTDYTTMPVDFYECLALSLAIDLCNPLTQSDERKKELRGELKTALAAARFVDATEDPAEQLEANDWVNSRVQSSYMNGRDYYAQG
jgi:hypothetical protein